MNQVLAARLGADPGDAEMYPITPTYSDPGDAEMYPASATPVAPGYSAVPASPSPSSASWMKLFTAVGSGLTAATRAYQQAGQPPQLPPQYAPSNNSGNSNRARDNGGINTKIGFDLNKGLNLGGTTIPTMYLALGGLMLFLLYKEPPRKGR